MKKVLLSVCLLGVITLVNARQLDGGKLKKHHCTAACKKEGHHVYAHGEKGHVCTAACDKPKS